MPYIGSQILGKHTQIFLENINWENMPKSWFPKQWMKQQIQAEAPWPNVPSPGRTPSRGPATKPFAQWELQGFINVMLTITSGYILVVTSG